MTDYKITSIKEETAYIQECAICEGRLGETRYNLTLNKIEDGMNCSMFKVLCSDCREMIRR